MSEENWCERLYHAAHVYRELVNSGVIPTNMSPTVIGQVITAEETMREYLELFKNDE